MKLDLSARYYIAEATVWLLGAILVVSHFVGLAPFQPIPLLNVTLENNQHFSRVVAVLLVAATLYLILGWKQSSLTARGSYWAQATAGFTTLWACVSFWLCYPLIAANTSFAGISLAWYLGFVAIGFLLGMSISVLAFASLMIRTPTEARTLHLPRIPAVTRAQYKFLIPIVIILLVANYVLWHFSPEVIKGIGFFFVYVPFLLMIGEEFASLCLSQDKERKRIPYEKRIAALKKAVDTHDYSYYLIDHGNKDFEKFGIPIKASPELIQKAIQEKLSIESSSEFRFHVQQIEEIQCEFYFKDGNKDNQLPKNRGIRVRKHQDKKGLFRVLVISEEPEKESQEIEIPTSLVETHAEKYLSNHIEDADLTFVKVLSYAINQTVIQTMIQQAGPLLQRLVEAGQEDKVEELLKQDVDVNEQAEAGWTALLYAAAQGYPRIVRLLLDAGANTDLGNALGITPLMYGARYGNIEVCRIMIEYGANPDLQDVYGMTALMISACIGNAEVAEMLLKAGASTNIKDRNTMSALDIAHKCKQGKIARMIRTANKSIQSIK